MMKRKWDHRGITLIEILVVVAIMSVVVGGAGVSLSLANSRDAEKCAKTIDAALENTRMMSMSQQGVFELELDMENNMLSVVRTLQTDAGTTQETVLQEQLQSRVDIFIPYDVDAASVTVAFDKSTGKVLSMSSETDGVLKITSENSNGKRATVVLVKGTGKHYVEYK